MPNKKILAITSASIPSGLRASVMAVASCLALSAMPLTANAAGLGRIVVFSALGQPLRAEIEVTATREELADMKAQLAAPEAFKQAGLDYASTLLGIRFSLDKRPKGPAVIKLSSDRPINDPFVDMLLQLDWSAGRLIREYTFLLDPPEVAAKAAAPVVPATAKPLTRTSKSSSVSATVIDDDVRNKAIARVRAQSPSAAASQSAAATTSHLVKTGETLRKIATETKPDGVSLDQMLVGLLRANQEAFDSGNMNRLKAGKILSIPDKSAIEAVSTDEARKVVVAQSIDWKAYQNRLAGMAEKASVAESAATQEAAGKITPKVEDKAAPSSESTDQLKVSKTKAGKVAADSKAAASGNDEDQIAKEKALVEANERVVALEKNVADLQQLLEMKNQSLAELQQQVGGKPSASGVKAAEPEASPAADATKPEVAVVAAMPSVDAEKPEAAIAAPAPTEVLPPPVESAPKAVENPKVVVPPAPVEEPGFLDGLLDNPLTLPAGGGVLALLAAFLLARRRRANREEVPLELSSTLSPQSASLSGNSVFRSTGGQSVDTSHTPAQTDFSQAGPGSIDTDEVDPVAEADVYMAYGRDAQAEEILLEAKQKDPKRHAIHVKLLEIYSNRKDVKQFETLATDLYGETGGSGPEWAKAAALGAMLVPGNPLFGGSAPNVNAVTSDTQKSAEKPLVVTEEFSIKEPVLSAPSLAAGDEKPVEPEAVALIAADLNSLDFDLGQADDNAADQKATKADENVEEIADDLLDSGALDFDLGSESVFFSKDEEPVAATPTTVPDPVIEVPERNYESAAATVVNPGIADLDFDIATDVNQRKSEASEAKTMIFEAGTNDVGNRSDAASKGADEVEFDVSLTESTFLGQTMLEPSSFDMDSIDLDLNVPELSIPEPASKPAAQAGATNDDPAGKLDALETFDELQVSTAVNPDFSSEQAETIVNSQFGAEQDEDMLPEFDISANEEVTTKLDLAKAYEEMGDFEGARELLQEVLKEGDASQREKAQSIIAKIGE